MVHEASSWLARVSTLGATPRRPFANRTPRGSKRTNAAEREQDYAPIYVGEDAAQLWKSCAASDCSARPDMRGRRIVYDGLWRCLCPAFDKPALRQALALNSLPSGRGGPLTARDDVRPTTAQSRLACFRLPGKRLMTTQSSPETATISHEPTLAPVTTATATATTPQNAAMSGYPSYEPLLAPTPPSEQTLRRASLDDIVAALWTMRQPEGWTSHGAEIDRHSRIILLVRHLLSDRRQSLSLFIYECMMDAMVGPQGSVAGVCMLLNDMASQNLKPTAALCQSALAALTNHPDYFLRLRILETMKEFWFSTYNSDTQSLVVLGLLRDEQYELAYLRLTEMMDQKVLIDLWVYDIFIVVFGKLGFLDEMLLLLYRRKSLVGEDKEIASLLYYALDVCSQAFHYPGTLFAWNCLVRTSLIQPSDGVVENVLATAARQGDTTLATEALDKISKRTRASVLHFEAVVEAFSADSDMAGAFRTLCVMKKNEIPIVRGTTRTVYEALVRHPTLIQGAEAILRSLVSPEQHVPMAAVGVVIEALAATRGTSKEAMDLYGDIPRLCGENADPAILQSLMLHSRDADTTRILARDYKAQVAAGGDDDVVRGTPIYQHQALAAACAEADELDLALRFALLAVKGMRSGMAQQTAGREKNLAWLKTLLGKAVEAQDTRIWPIVDGLGRQDEKTKTELTRMLRHAKITSRAVRLET